jgi:putative transcriptional regulator
MNRLRVLRAERRWSQADLAERLGVSRQTVNAIETGRYDPSLPLAFRIAQVFELRIGRSSSRKRSPHPASDRVQGLLSRARVHAP